LIVGVVIAVIAVVVIAIVAIYCIVTSRKKRGMINPVIDEEEHESESVSMTVL